MAEEGYSVGRLVVLGVRELDQLVSSKQKERFNESRKGTRNQHAADRQTLHFVYLLHVVSLSIFYFAQAAFKIK